jgi:bifunctional non-homologous end joining protein LigD
VLRPCPGPRWGTGQVGKPCLPTKAPQPPTGDAWLHEIKHAGFRVVARKEGKHVRLYSRPGNDLTYRFPLIVEALARLRSPSCTARRSPAATTAAGTTFRNLCSERRLTVSE